MALLAVFLAAFLLAATSLHVAGQPGFLSIDCGLDAARSPRLDSETNITYVSDGPYVDGGENRKVEGNQESPAQSITSLKTLRSFSSGVRNCYTLPTESGARYVVRMEFMHGNYDGTNSPFSFDLHLGTNYWDTVTIKQTTDYTMSEAVFAAWASWVPLCLVKTGSGNPFVNTVELRLLGAFLYPHVNTDQAMASHDRVNLGTTDFTRFPHDRYDRYWFGRNGSSLASISTQKNIVYEDQDSYAVPIPVLQKAVTNFDNGTSIFASWKAFDPLLSFKVFLHFTDFQKSQFRQFDINITQERLPKYSPKYLTSSSVTNQGWLKSADGNYTISVKATSISELPPMISAFEIYRLIRNDTSRTFSNDFDAMMAIKSDYGVKKNWNGDPCLPANYTWNGVKCSNSTGTTRIISLDLSKSNLNGSISDNFKLLTELKSLNLSGNSLNGSVPYTLCKNNGGPLVFRSESGEDMCNKIISPPPSKSKIAIISISVVVPIVIVVVLAISCLIWRRKRKLQISTYDHHNAPKPSSAAVSVKSHGDHLHNSENRQFTYKELEKFTNKFERSIGQGGFGLVYYGRLEDDTEVAVKMRSETSSHGLDEFLAEVNSLTKVHHRNLVSLVGYCWEKDHLALVYEYMSQGSLCDLLRGKQGAGETLSWGTRVRIVLESAQGLDYLHKGCSLPIIHRDVKTNNILLGQNLRAKIADFGLCKTYLNDMQTHISTNAAGSAGYMDPEYYHTGWLTESSDVYSFGVVLLEVATGEPPILPGHGHIVQRVKQKIASGNIGMVADAKLGGAYDVNSMWKLIDTAMACTSDAAIRRPTMATVVAQLKESLALEESREDNSVMGSFTSTAGAPVSTFGPSAR